MTKRILAVAAAALFLGGVAGSVAEAGIIERACMGSGRPGASTSLCGCIQNVADMTLDRRDQRMAAKFFRDPHQAQEVRQSDNRSHEIFWQKYRQFGASAEAYCG